jgi:AcrR family transcriptional regulator
MAKPAPDQRKSAILDAVVRVIIDIGFTEMTVADVAKQAGVSTALVHYHFSSKAELITAALHDASDEDKELRDSVADGPGTAVSRLDRVLCGTMPIDGDDGSWLLWIETWGETRRNPAIRDVMADLGQHETAVVVRLIEEGTAAGECQCGDPPAAAARLAALRDGLAIEYTLFDADRPASVYLEQLRGSIRNNLGLSPADYSSLRGG